MTTQITPSLKLVISRSSDYEPMQEARIKKKVWYGWKTVVYRQYALDPRVLLTNDMLRVARQRKLI